MTHTPPCDLDPEDWEHFRALGHQMMDDMVDHLRGVRHRTVWQPMPDTVRADIRQGALPRTGDDLARIYADFQRLVQPYTAGNTHPRFFGWVHGAGNPAGMLADLLAAGLNGNLGGRDHAPIEIERLVIRWSAEMLGFPATAGGVLVTGTSIANLVAVLAARQRALGPSVRRHGLGGARLAAYASTAAHGCVPRALDMAGLGSDALRRLPTDANGRLDLPALRARIAADRAEGWQPFMVVGTAGSVDTGAIDDLAALAALCAEQALWFHIDGAFGALAMLSPRLRPMLAGMEQADSVAFDFHKWGQVPYDCGCILVRDQATLLATFAQDLAYLRPESRGLAGNPPWPCDLGPDLSRGFRALKVWMTLRAHGADRIGAAIERCCANARYLATRIEAESRLELLAPVALNIVCFRARQGAGDLNQFNRDLVADLQESGIAAPSTTMLDGRLAIRVAVVNHRTRPSDMDILLAALLQRLEC